MIQGYEQRRRLGMTKETTTKKRAKKAVAKKPVSKNLFWLDDLQWSVLEKHLPKNQRGARRKDDRRIISGIIHVLHPGVAGRTARKNTVHRQRCTTAFTVGRRRVCGKVFSTIWRPSSAHITRTASTAPQLKPTAPPAVKR